MASGKILKSLSLQEKKKIAVVFALFLLLAAVSVTALCIALQKPAPAVTGGYKSVAKNEWLKNELTEGFPEFPATPVKVLLTDYSAAMFFEQVYAEQADGYAEALKNECLLDLPQTYPKTAQKDGVTIALHYDAETKELSITFTGEHNNSLAE